MARAIWYEITLPLQFHVIESVIANNFCIICPHPEPRPAAETLLLTGKGRELDALGEPDIEFGVEMTASFWIPLCDDHARSTKKAMRSRIITGICSGVLAFVAIWIVAYQLLDWFRDSAPWRQFAVMLAPGIVIFAGLGHLFGTYRGTREIREKVRFTIFPRLVGEPFGDITLQFSEKSTAIAVARRSIERLVAVEDQYHSKLFDCRKYGRCISKSLIDWSSDDGAVELADRLEEM